MNPLVSIIIPAFNAQNWIADSIRSAMGQTWANKEIIVVDDGSTDRTLEVARQFESGQIAILTQDNAGASSARNRGLEIAQGDLIQWLDADDLLAPEKIRGQLEASGSDWKSGQLISSGWGLFFHWPGRSLSGKNSLWRDLEPVDWMCTKFEENAWMCIESWLVGRQLSDEVGTWNEELSLDDDGEYFGRVVSGSAGIRFVPIVGSYCRAGNQGSLSSTVNISHDKLLSQFTSLRLNIEYLLSLEDSMRTREASMMLLQRWSPLFHDESAELFSEVRDLVQNLGGSLGEPANDLRHETVRSFFGEATLTWLRLVRAGFRTFPRRFVDRILLKLHGNDPLKAFQGSD